MCLVNHQDNYTLLLTKLDEFIRKYYKNQLIRGSLYALTGLMAVFLLVAILEYFGQFNSGIRAALFYTYLCFAVFVLGKYVVLPAAHWMQLGSVLNYEQASTIIGIHFPEVKDKLLNILQLKQGAGNSSSRELIEAGINQKITEIKPVPFASAINLNQNFRYAKYAAVPLAAFALIQLTAPSMISDSSQRLVNYNKFFPKVAPFTFTIENKELKAAQKEDFELAIHTGGEVLPNEVFIEVNGTMFKMHKQEKNTFSYRFKNIQHDISFRFFADEFYSQEYRLDMLAKPSILNFTVQLEYPSYLGKKNEQLNNSGDLTIPAGTKVSWKFKTKNVSSMSMHLSEGKPEASEEKSGIFGFSKKFVRGSLYHIITRNQDSGQSDSLTYSIQVIPDAFPSIQVIPRTDSLLPKTVYFIGEIEDDHGFRRLQFVYSVLKKDGKQINNPVKNTINLGVRNGQLKQNFYHMFNLASIDIQMEDEVEYYFEVWDNDGVTGSKSTRSQVQLYKAPNKAELKEQAENNSKQLKDEMKEAIIEARALNKEMKELQQKMLEKKELSWEEKKKLDEMLKREKELEKKINTLQEEAKRNAEQQQQFTKTDETILQKQEELQKMWDQVLNPEIKQLMQKLENMMKQNNKEQMQKDLEQMELNNKEVEKELDRMLELYKKLEIEQTLKENADALQKLSEKQEKLSEQTKDKKADQEQLKEQQKEISNEFEQIKKDLEQLEQKNEKLEQPEKLPDTNPEEKETKEELDNSRKQLEEKENKKAAESQKKAAKKMQEMSDKMKKSMQSEQGKKEEEDYDALRALLENLIQLSKDQEELMQQMGAIQSYNPQYVKLAQKQKELKDYAQIAEDSLFALSKRVPQISAFINRELGEVNFNMDKAIKNFAERDIQQGRARQQYVMTSVNNIAVMLTDVLKQMQQSMQEGSGSGSGGKVKKKGKGSQPSLGELMKMQDQLNEMLKNGMKPGGKDGKGSPGGMGSKEFAEMAAKQAAIRRQLQQMQQQMQKEGKAAGGSSGLSKELKEMQQLMEQTEKDLVNKRLNSETIKRQEEIKTRMLEAEKADKEREQDNKRESKTADEKSHTLPPDIEEFLKQKTKEQELLLTIPPSLQPYYREKSKNYFNLIGK